MPNNVTCHDCQNRLTEGSAKVLKARYRIGSPATVARPLAQGHAMYWLDSMTLVSLCKARTR